MFYFGIVIFGLLVCQCAGHDLENMTTIRTWVKNNCKLELPPANLNTDTFSDIVFRGFPDFERIPEINFSCKSFTICRWTYYFEDEQSKWIDQRGLSKTEFCIYTDPKRINRTKSPQKVSGKIFYLVMGGGNERKAFSNVVFRTSVPHGDKDLSDIKQLLEDANNASNDLRCPSDPLCTDSTISVKRTIYRNYDGDREIKPTIYSNNTIYMWNYLFVGQRGFQLTVELDTSDVENSSCSLSPGSIQHRNSDETTMTKHPPPTILEGFFISRRQLHDKSYYNANDGSFHIKRCKDLYFGEFENHPVSGFNVKWIDAGKKNVTQLTTAAPGKEVTTKETTTESTTEGKAKKKRERPEIGNGNDIRPDIPESEAEGHLKKAKELLSYQLENNEKISHDDFENVLKVYKGVWKADSVAKNRSNHKKYGSEISQQLSQYTQILSTNKTFKVSNDLFEIEIRPIEEIKEFEPLHYSANTSNINVMIPYQVFTLSSNPTSRQVENSSSITNSSTVSFVFYPTAEFFVSEDNVSNVLSIEVGHHVENLTQPIQISHGDINVTNEKTENPNNTLLAKRILLVCVYWDYVTNKWSKSGSCLNTSTSTPICQYNHLSSFAMIVRNEDVPNDAALSLASIIGLSFSIFCLFLTILVHLLNRKAMKVRYTKIFLNICVNMLLAYFFFAIGMSQIQNKPACLAMAILSHYFFLATWFWKSAYSYEIYQSFVKVFVQSKPKYMQKLAIFGYVIPFIIVVITIGITFFYGETDDSSVCGSAAGTNKFALGRYLAPNVCWITGDILTFSFLSPCAILLIWNIAVLARVVVELKQNKSGNSVNDKEEGRQHSAICITFAMTIGVSWSTGYMILLSTDPIYYLVLSWIFTITTSLQGLLIFFFAVVRRRNLWKPVVEQSFNFSMAKQSFYDSTESSGVHSRATTKFTSNRI